MAPKTKSKVAIAALIEFTKEGGRVLLAEGQPNLPIAESEALIQSFGFNWKLSSINNTSTQLFYPIHPLFPTFSPSMLETYTSTAHTLRGVGAEEIVFCNDEDQDQVGVAMGRIVSGFFGVIGDSLKEEGSRRIALALLDLPCS